ncbi:MAG: hypothetical protein C0613_07025 [Desulfobulbaceae bacterium]|nr:MAG: hypothetical protein C0613_07025 [Desulfobulbaceae bacterium]
MKSCLSTNPLLLLVGALLFIAAAGPAAAYTDDMALEEAVRIAEQDLFEHKKKLGRIKKGLQSQQENFEQTRRQEEQLLTELAQIDERIVEESRRLVTIYQQLQVEKKKTQEALAAFEEVREDKKRLAEQTKKRLAAYYRMGDIGILNITFSSATLPELVTFHEYYRSMLRHDLDLFERFQASLIRLEVARDSHEKQQVSLEKAMSQAKEQQQILAASKEQRRELLVKLQAEKDLYKQAAATLEQSAAALISELEELERQAEIARMQKEEWMIATFPLEPHKKRKPAWKRGFGGQEGILPPPVDGTVVNLFGNNDASPGIDFAIEPSAIVRAVFKGKVVHTGFVKGYGQVVIISHTDGYYTLTSGMATFLVKKESLVEQGAEIGMASEHVGPLQTLIHFEIRHKTDPEDPLEWLDPELLILAPALKQTSPRPQSP